MELPDCAFYVFGMGDRRKLLYREGRLTDALSGEPVRQWTVRAETIRAPEYRVELDTSDGALALVEDEAGVWIETGSGREPLVESPLSLPRFDDRPHGDLLRVLHQEVLVGIVNGLPVPNLLAYAKPWYRDAAAMAMVLERTGNLRLIEDWVAGLREPYDRNAHGNEECDNLGQALYLISLVSDPAHALVQTLLAETERWREGDHIAGVTDYGSHPVFQTKWLKFGLRALGLDDPWAIPEVYDGYSALCWWGFKDSYVEGPGQDEHNKQMYPYLAWAEGHFHGWQFDLPPADWRWPLTWEAEASDADYEAMRAVCGEYFERRIAAPHAWHAAEMFLYVDDGLGL